MHLLLECESYHITALHLLIGLGPGMVQAVATGFSLRSAMVNRYGEMASWSIASALLAAEQDG